MNPTTQEVIGNYERALVKIILCCITQLPFQFGKKRVCGVLKGTKSSFVIDHEIYKLEVYGILPNFRQAYLTAIIDKMLENQLLEIEMVSKYKNIPTLKVTEKGLDYFDGEDVTEIKFVQEFSDKDVILLDDEERGLFEELRVKRWEFAQERSIPAYVVCSNVSLREMAKSQPSNQSEMLQVNGIGGKFIESYGEEFLNTIESFSEKVGV